ncbi:MAG TPA: tRNA 2-thiouridine(34) synthase MnmA [Byssovorax sp.]
MSARVVVAMSGGVDSTVAAARLVDRGFEVVGVTLHLWDYPDDGSVRGRCCAPEDQRDARRAADFLGIPHFTFDRRELFAARVTAPFVDAYLDGRTPSPCVSCNQHVKMRELLPLADRLGAAFVATGHYARVERDAAGKARLHRAADSNKDQSYFLHMLREDELARLVLPLGDATKADVRADARARRLPGADKGESQELCFVPTGRYDAFVRERAAGRVRPGPIVDRDGRVVGAHEGVHAFTIGQRKGLGVALGKPAFVTALDRASGTVTLGDDADLLADGARLDAGAWSDDVTFPLAATLRVRAHHEGEAGLIERAGAELVARFDAPVRAVSPGQVAVAYAGERVLGGATILGALRRTATAAALGAAAFAALGCSLGQGGGQVYSDHLFARDCWGTADEDTSQRPAYNMQPDFFAANPFREQMLIRIQRGNDIEELSDGLEIDIDDVQTLRDRLGRAELVSIPAGIQPPGAPLEPPTTPLLDDPPLVHMSLYLSYSCHNQGTVLNAVDGTITFEHLFSGNPNEQVGAEKLSQAQFEIDVGDLQDVPLGEPADAVPIELQSHFVGSFQFYFERGQPGQPFP